MTQSSWFDFPSAMSSPAITNFPSITFVRNGQMEDISVMGEILALSFSNFNNFTFWIYPLYKLGICSELKSRLQEQLAKHKDDRDTYCLVAVQVTNINKQISQQVVGTVEFSIRCRSSWYNHNK